MVFTDADHEEAGELFDANARVADRIFSEYSKSFQKGLFFIKICVTIVMRSLF